MTTTSFMTSIPQALGTPCSRCNRFSAAAAAAAAKTPVPTPTAHGTNVLARLSFLGRHALQRLCHVLGHTSSGPLTATRTKRTTATCRKLGSTPTPATTASTECALEKRSAPVRGNRLGMAFGPGTTRPLARQTRLLFVSNHGTFVAWRKNYTHCSARRSTCTPNRKPMSLCREALRKSH